MSGNLTVPEFKHAANTLDWRAAEMLKAIDRANDDRVSTTDIREATGLDNSQVRVRRENLAELDLIETEKKKQRSGVPMTYHSINRRGKSALRRGFLDQFDMGEPGDFDELVARIETVESRFDGIEAEIQSVRTRVEDLARNVESRLGGATSVDEDLEALREDIDELQERADRDTNGGLFS